MKRREWKKEQRMKLKVEKVVKRLVKVPEKSTLQKNEQPSAEDGNKDQRQGHQLGCVQFGWTQ